MLSVTALLGLLSDGGEKHPGEATPNAPHHNDHRDPSGCGHGRLPRPAGGLKDGLTRTISRARLRKGGPAKTARVRSLEGSGAASGENQSSSSIRIPARSLGRLSTPAASNTVEIGVSALRSSTSIPN